MVQWVIVAMLAWQEPDYVEQGRKALDSKRNEEAAELFRKAVKADAKDFTAHFHLALADSLLQRDEEAVAEYRRALELKPDLYEANLNLGILLLRDKHEGDAIGPLESAVTQKPAEFRPNFYSGQALLAVGKPVEAQRRFEAALHANAKSGAAELGLARSLLRQDQLAESEAHFRAASALEPGLHEALLELGAAQDKAGHKPEAIAIYQQFPANPSAQARLGELMVENQQFADAIPRLEKAVATDPTVTNRLNLADAYRMNKQFDKQNEQLSKAVDSDATNFDLRMTYGRALRDQRQLVPAANQFFAAAKIKPDSSEAWNELASVLIVHGDNVQGLAALDKVRALGKEKPGDHYLRAITLDKLHQRREAVASYKQFLAVSEGKFPDQEFAARQRIRIIESELNKR